MDRQKHNLSQRLPLRLLLLLATSLPVLSACGRWRSSDGGGSAEATFDPADFYKSPTLTPVPVGSRDVVASPPAGSVKGTLLFRLLSEPGAKIRYSFRNFAADAPVSSLSDYQEGLPLLPPVTVWAQAEKDGERGPVRSFAYEFDTTYWPSPTFTSQRRLPASGWQPIPAAKALLNFTPATDAEAAAAAIPVVDGRASEWSMQSRLAALDAPGDVPETHGFIDLAWAEIRETTDAYYLVMATRERPTVGEGTYYGVDFGPSHITAASFGEGTDFVYRAEVAAGKLNLIIKETNKPTTFKASNVVLDEVVEFKLAKADLPLLGDARELTARPYAVDFTHGPTIADRLEPLFVRSNFSLRREVVDSAAATDSGRPWQFDVLASPAVTDASLVPSYAEMAAAFLPELESINALRFYNRGTLPLFLVDKEEKGYAGLNTTDRGMLSTIGPMSSRIGRAQILAHELAHYQNARSSQMKPRWLQEGMSEWSAERLLYKHFPPRAAHRFLKKLRYGRLAGIDTEEDLPLSRWGDEVATLGYEKSLGFLALLEVRVGHAALIAAFQQAVNEPMDSAAFQTFLEERTGKDLEGLFRYWVNEGDPEPENDPTTLFSDLDGDGLLALDEEMRGTDPARADSDSDGYPDGEEVFGGTDPNRSALDPNGTRASTALPVLANATSTATSALARLGGAKAQTFTYSLDPYDPAPTTAYVQPLLLRPPYRLAVAAKVGTTTQSPTVLTRPLYVGGVAQTITPPTEAVLPVPLKLTTTLHSGAAVGSGVGRDVAGDLPLLDANGDLPPELAAYDLIETRVSEGEAALTITLKTAAKPDSLGQYGDYVVTFDAVEWFPSGAFFKTTSYNALGIVGGAPYWSVYKDGDRSTELAKSGIAVAVGNDLKLKIDNSRLAAWYAAAGDRMICVRSDVTLDGAESFSERGGCVTVATDDFVASASSLSDAYGIGRHTVEVFVKAASSADQRGADLAALGTSALREFELALGRPLLDRSYWPVHIQYKSSGSAGGSGAAGIGAYLSIAVADEGSKLDYLVVEQLARVVTADILSRSGGAPYWVQEAFIQWLTGAAMYALYPTAAVHDFHYRRLDDYECFLGPSSFCNGLYPQGDLPLELWNSTTLDSSGSVKSLAFVLDLNGRFGSAVMSRVFSTFSHGIPSSASMLRRLKGETSGVSGAAATLDAMWTTWVTGSGVSGSGADAADEAAIRARLADNDGDHLLRLEEDQLGYSDAADNPGYD